MINIFWFRRDLRLEDNTALYKALTSGLPVQPIFIFDTNILVRLEDKNDARVSFIYETITKIKTELNQIGSDLWVFYGKPEIIFEQLLNKEEIKGVYSNCDYEPYAISRDEKIKNLCSKKSVGFYTSKDHVFFEKNEIVKDDGKPYTVFTPYKNKWLAKFNLVNTEELYFPSENYLQNVNKTNSEAEIPTLNEMGFIKSTRSFPPNEIPQTIVSTYDKNRDYPGMDATSKLGIHFRFGTISIRQKVQKASVLNQTYLNELIWRDFYSMILWFYPNVTKKAFKPQYENIVWSDDVSLFQAWCDGKTGYPLVDAGMRQLKTTGFMHNRVRMVTASFLCKHLLIDWRWGESWFARHLLDFDLSSNNGGWQWAAGCGTDAAPYFRIFNPTSQQEKFDKNMTYIKRWVPEYGTAFYPAPIVDHKEAREKCLQTYKKALLEI
ncbi:MAG: deoxyribodipyrimidine photo-lyase [Saprospiraceae bacterium]|nr:deoxyribodipyrimidine photo-lyase [Saprospiraceae bacterium]